MRNRNSQSVGFGRRWGGRPMELANTVNNGCRLRCLSSVLAYHYGAGRQPNYGAGNEIVVLSLGIDQYLQEVFHNLDFDGQGTIYSDDFRRLCHVLGFREDEFCRNLPSAMSFREFHARLCESVANKYDETDYIPFDCKVPKGEYLRSKFLMRESGERALSFEAPMEDSMQGESFGSFPRKVTVYKKCRVDTIKSNANWGSLDRHSQRSREGVHQKAFHSGFLSNGSPCSRKTSKTDGTNFFEWSENASVVKNAEREEAECLREIIEDLRAALQSSDARCIALQVALKNATESKNSDGTRSKSGITLSESLRELQSKHDYDKYDCSSQGRLNKNSKDTVEALSRRLVAVRESRDQEVTELIALVNHLQMELSETHIERESLEERNRSLLEQLLSIGQRFQGTRKLFEIALAKVRELEGRVETIPELEEKIVFLQTEKESSTKERSRKRTRSRGNKLDDVLAFIRGSRQHTKSIERKPPMGSSQDSIDSNAIASEPESRECHSANRVMYSLAEGPLHRDVEGKSGSDEECPQTEASIRRPRSWMSVETSKSLKLQECLASLNSKLHQVSDEKRKLNEELQCCRLRNNETQKELENVEAERVRLFVLEEKLQESINMMRFLRGKFLSRRTMGKFVLDVIDECYGEGPREEFVADKFVEKLLKKLSSSELLRADTYHKLPFSNIPNEVPWSDFQESSFRLQTEDSEK